MVRHGVASQISAFIIGQKLYSRCVKGPFDKIDIKLFITFLTNSSFLQIPNKMNISRNIFKTVRYNIINRLQIIRQYLTCSITEDNEYLQLIKENKTHYFPLVWLRDNCRCENCYHGPSSSRILNWDAFNIDVKIRSAEVSIVNFKNLTI